jgi:hypothetical protein
MIARASAEQCETRHGHQITNSWTSFASKLRNHSWTQSVQGAVATWSVIDMWYFLNDSRHPSLTRSLPLPVLTVSKHEIRFLRQGLVDMTIDYMTTNSCGPVTCGLSVVSNEGVNGTGDGNSNPDWRSSMSITSASGRIVRARDQDASTPSLLPVATLGPRQASQLR